ncbi:hypothetical protein BDR07DRAFT_1415886 [Suillus spraguei]|nr:hypothetical protein BDR07DRAFT_1415886 [Suillus spraguei]
MCKFVVPARIAQSTTKTNSFTTRRKGDRRMLMERMSKSQHTSHSSGTAVGGSVSSAANTLSFVVPVGSLVNKHMAKHARFRVAHLCIFAIAVLYAPSSVVHGSYEQWRTSLTGNC